MEFPLTDPALPLNQQDPVSLFAAIILAEAANQTDQAKLGVAMVVRNRWLRKVGFGSTWTAVLLQENAFSVTIRASKRYPVLLNPLKYETIDTWRKCYLAAAIAYYGLNVTDPTAGAHFYFSPPVCHPPQDWGIVQPTVIIDQLHFYRQAPPAQTKAA